MDIDASNWNEDDNSNTTAAPDGAPEGMAPSGVNNVLRAIMGALKRRRNWGAPKTTGGSATAYTLSYTVAPGALVDGMTHLVEFNAANGNAPTLNVNTLGAIPIHYYSAGAWRAVPAALWDANEVFRVAYHSSSGAYRLLHFKNRTGEVQPFAGSTAPGGTLLCFGQAVSRSAYAGLFAALGTTYGVGDGSTTFNLPDLRGRVAAGKSDMGGSDAGNLAGGTVLGAALGGQTNTASVSGSTSGTLGVSGTTDVPGSGAANWQPGPDASVNSSHQHNFSGTAAGTLSVSGTASAFSVVQPTRILNYLIRI
jgi:microcystin-dependent protein